VVWRYHEITPINKKSEEHVAYAMRVGVKEKNVKLYVKMIKLLIVANPTHGHGFLEELSFDFIEFMTCLLFILDLMLYMNQLLLLMEVERHWISNKVSKITLEKL